MRDTTLLKKSDGVGAQHSKVANIEWESGGMCVVGVVSPLATAAFV